MKMLINFSAIHLSYVLSCIVFCCVANRVATMHELLTCSGWQQKMGHPDYPIRIIDRRRADQPGRQLRVEQLLATTVVEGNVDDKIQVAHQFLSCLYAKVLMDVCDYENGIGPQCRLMERTSKSFKCLKDYQQVIQHKHPLVSRMIGSLSAVQKLASSETHLEKEVFEILESMRNFYRQRTVVRSPDGDDQTIRETVHTECKAIETHAQVTFNRLFASYNRFCWPVCDYILVLGFTKPSDNIRRIIERNTGRKTRWVVYSIKEELARIFKEFTEYHDNSSGFEYDPESDTTRIITYDPNTVDRAEKMNRLLGNTYFWTSLKPLEINERGSPYRTGVEDFLKPAGGPYDTVIVTKDNVYAKLKRAHHILSCKYSLILKECCDHVANMWTSCQESNDLVCVEKFLRILKEADLPVLRMINALSYFQKLSPDTVYKNGVFDSLKRFKNFYNDRTAREDRDVMSWTPDIENYISEIEHSSTEFWQQFCYSEIEFECLIYYFGENEKNSTIDVKGEKFISSIRNLTYSHAVLNYKRNGNLFESL